MLKRLVTLSLFFLSACTSSYRMADLGIISPEINAIEPEQLKAAEIIHDVKGQDSTSVFLIFPQGYPNLEYAIRRALENSQADILVNVKVDYISSWYLFRGENRIELTADAVRLAPLFPNLGKGDNSEND